MAHYDSIYQKKDLFGKPLPELIEFFEQSRRGSIADLGAGQGRDSIPLFDMGFDVTAVDISKVGLGQIEKKQPGIETVEAGLEDFDLSEFDYVLMDSMIHLYKNNHMKEIEILSGIINRMKPGAVFVNCMCFAEYSKKLLEEFLARYSLKTLLDSKVWYPEGKCEYHILALEKTVSQRNSAPG